MNDWRAEGTCAKKRGNPTLSGVCVLVGGITIHEYCHSEGLESEITSSGAAAAAAGVVGRMTGLYNGTANANPLPHCFFPKDADAYYGRVGALCMKTPIDDSRYGPCDQSDTREWRQPS
jgi:hypothetical protein